ncbi:MAG: UPF0146 family protein [Methanosarcinales archaeon Met12]|nr:MAG: UPF0146 family protein [Methanosarcinales archaeon Met12]
MAITGHKDLAEYILRLYRGKIVEVGIGKHPEVALLLKDRLDVTVTDVMCPRIHGIRFIRDDIFNPDIQIYKGASLIYSIRPPIDLQCAIASVARKVDADMIIRPFASERANIDKYFVESLVNYKDAAFYLYKRQVKER